MKAIKITVLLVLSVLLAQSVSAQSPISFGVKAGLNLSEIQKMEDAIKVGFNLGVTAEMQLPSDLFLSSGLMLTAKGANDCKEVSFLNESGVAVKDINMNALYLQVPIHVGYKVNITPTAMFFVQGGPYLAYGIGGKVKSDDKTVDVKFFGDGTNRFDFGIGGAVGVEFINKVSVSLGADQGLTKIHKDFSTKNRCAHLSVGYKF